MKRLVSTLFALMVCWGAAACAHAGALVSDGSAEESTEVAPEPGAVDHNTATEPDLIALPGIGPTKAAAIVAYRKKHGPFDRVTDLRKVRGFGRKTVARLRPMVTVARRAVPPPVPTGTSGSAPAAAIR
jgi:competence ComEA-like helix-hairpin-helix protein